MPDPDIAEITVFKTLILVNNLQLLITSRKRTVFSTFSSNMAQSRRLIFFAKKIDIQINSEINVSGNKIKHVPAPRLACLYI